MIPACKKIYLCAPDMSKLCILNGLQTESVDFHPQIKGYSELSFTVDRFINIDGKLVESNGYEDLKPYMYIYLEDIGYFIIEPPETSYDGNHEQKTVTAYSAEKEFENRDWVGIKINCGTPDSMEYSNTGDYNKDSIAGFAQKYVHLVDMADENLSFLHQILKKISSKWSIGYISPSLVADTVQSKGKTPTFKYKDDNSVGAKIKLGELRNLAYTNLKTLRSEALSVINGYDTGIFGNIDLNNRQEIIWTDSNLNKYPYATSTAGVVPGELSTVLGTWNNFNDLGVSLAYTPLLQIQGESEPVLLSEENYIYYLRYLIQEAKRLSPTNYASKILELDKNGFDITDQYGHVLKNLVAGVSTSLLEGNCTDIIASVMHYYETEEDDIALNDYIYPYIIQCFQRENTVFVDHAKLPAIDIDSQNLYAVMTSEVAPRMSCLFIFDYLNFSINVYHKDDLDIDTNIFIGFRNLEQNVSISVDSDSIFTRFSVQGEGELNFRDINYGDNTIINLDYFLNEPYMTQEMVEKYQSWQHLRELYLGTYIDKAKEYNELNEKKSERTYAVPSDASYWKNWDSMNMEGLTENYKFYTDTLKWIQESCDDRPDSEKYDSEGNYYPLMTNGTEVSRLLTCVNTQKFGNVNLADRQNMYWSQQTIDTYNTSEYNYISKYISVGDVSKVLGSWRIFEPAITNSTMYVSIAYSTLLQTEEALPVVLKSSDIERYLIELINRSTNTITGIVDFEQIIELDKVGFSSIKTSDNRIIKGIVAYVSPDYTRNESFNSAGVANLVMWDLEGNNKEDAIKKVSTYAGSELSEETVSYNGVDHNWYLQKLYEQIDAYSGYYTYREIIEYILPYIQLSIENYGKISEDKHKPTTDISENWDLYGLEELDSENGVREQYQDILKMHYKYAKAWNEMSTEEKEETGLNVVDDGSGEQYEAMQQRKDYLHAKEQLGNENTPGTILYRIKQLKDEIAEIQAQMDEVTAITQDFATIMRYNVTEEEIDDCTHLSSQLRADRKACLFDEREMWAFEALLKDTDYVNTNIVVTSIMSLSEHLEKEQELYDDASDKLVEVAQPQYKFSVSMDNFFRLPDYSAWAEEFQPASSGPPIGLLKFIRVGLRDDYAVKLRVIGYRWNPCEVTPELTIEFSNMITSRSGRSDLTELLETENYRGSKNSIRIGNGTASSAEEYITTFMEYLKDNTTFLKTVQQIASGTSGILNAGQIDGLITDYLVRNPIQTSIGTISGDTYSALFSEYISAEAISTKIIDADTGNFNEIFANALSAININAKNIVGENGDFQSLYTRIFNANQATINDLIAGQVTADTVTAALGNFTKANIDVLSSNNAFIENLNTFNQTYYQSVGHTEIVKQFMAEYISVGDLHAGDIVIDKNMVIRSKARDDGTDKSALYMDDYGLQIFNKDGDVAINLGLTEDGRPNLVLTDGNNNILLDVDGLKQNAIVDGLIENRMVKSGTLTKDKLGFQIIEPNDRGGVDLSQIFVEGNQDNFGVIWTSFYNDTQEFIEETKNNAKSVEISGPQVFVESGGNITPENITLTATAKGGAIPQKWFVDGVEDFDHTSIDRTQFTIPSSMIADKKTLTVRVECVESNVFDVMSIYKVTDGNSAYTVVLTSSKGELFKEETTTNCQCKVYYGSRQIFPKKYIWHITTDDGERIEETIDNNIDITVSSSNVKTLVRCSVDV